MAHYDPYGILQNRDPPPLLGEEGLGGKYNPFGIIGQAAATAPHLIGQAVGAFANKAPIEAQALTPLVPGMPPGMDAVDRAKSDFMRNYAKDFASEADQSREAFAQEYAQNFPTATTLQQAKRSFANFYGDEGYGISAESFEGVRGVETRKDIQKNIAREMYPKTFAIAEAPILGTNMVDLARNPWVGGSYRQSQSLVSAWFKGTSGLVAGGLGLTGAAVGATGAGEAGDFIARVGKNMNEITTPTHIKQIEAEAPSNWALYTNPNYFVHAGASMLSDLATVGHLANKFGARAAANQFFSHPKMAQATIPLYFGVKPWAGQADRQAYHEAAGHTPDEARDLATGESFISSAIGAAFGFLPGKMPKMYPELGRDWVAHLTEAIPRLAKETGKQSLFSLMGPMEGIAVDALRGEDITAASALDHLMASLPALTGAGLHAVGRSPTAKALTRAALGADTTPYAQSLRNSLDDPARTAALRKYAMIPAHEQPSRPDFRAAFPDLAKKMRPGRGDRRAIRDWLADELQAGPLAQQYDNLSAYFSAWDQLTTLYTEGPKPGGVREWQDTINLIAQKGAQARGRGPAASQEQLSVMGGDPRSQALKMILYAGRASDPLYDQPYGPQTKADWMKETSGVYTGEVFPRAPVTAEEAWGFAPPMSEPTVYSGDLGPSGPPQVPAKTPSKSPLEIALKAIIADPQVGPTSKDIAARALANIQRTTTPPTPSPPTGPVVLTDPALPEGIGGKTRRLYDQILKNLAMQKGSQSGGLEKDFANLLVPKDFAYDGLEKMYANVAEADSILRHVLTMQADEPGAAEFRGLRLQLIDQIAKARQPLASDRQMMNVINQARSQKPTRENQIHLKTLRDILLSSIQQHKDTPYTKPSAEPVGTATPTPDPIDLVPPTTIEGPPTATGFEGQLLPVPARLIEPPITGPKPPLPTTRTEPPVSGVPVTTSFPTRLPESVGEAAQREQTRRENYQRELPGQFSTEEFDRARANGGNLDLSDVPDSQRTAFLRLLRDIDAIQKGKPLSLEHMASYDLDQGIRFLSDSEIISALPPTEYRRRLLRIAESYVRNQQGEDTRPLGPEEIPGAIQRAREDLRTNYHDSNYDPAQKLVGRALKDQNLSDNDRATIHELLTDLERASKFEGLERGDYVSDEARQVMSDFAMYAEAIESSPDADLAQVASEVLDAAREYSVAKAAGKETPKQPPPADEGIEADLAMGAMLEDVAGPGGLWEELGIIPPARRVPALVAGLPVEPIPENTTSWVADWAMLRSDPRQVDANLGAFLPPDPAAAHRIKADPTLPPALASGPIDEAQHPPDPLTIALDNAAKAADAKRAAQGKGTDPSIGEDFLTSESGTADPVAILTANVKTLLARVPVPTQLAGSRKVTDIMHGMTARWARLKQQARQGLQPSAGTPAQVAEGWWARLAELEAAKQTMQFTQRNLKAAADEAGVPWPLESSLTQQLTDALQARIPISAIDIESFRAPIAEMRNLLEHTRTTTAMLGLKQLDYGVEMSKWGELHLARTYEVDVDPEYWRTVKESKKLKVDEIIKETYPHLNDTQVRAETERLLREGKAYDPKRKARLATDADTLITDVDILMQRLQAPKRIADWFEPLNKSVDEKTSLPQKGARKLEADIKLEVERTGRTATPELINDIRTLLESAQGSEVGTWLQRAERVAGDWKMDEAGKVLHDWADIPPQIRDMWGEHRGVDTKFQNTFKVLTDAISKRKFEQVLLEVGIDRFLWTGENRPPETISISEANSLHHLSRSTKKRQQDLLFMRDDPSSLLKDLYVHPEFYNSLMALTKGDLANRTPGLYRQIERANALVKLGYTLWNLPSYPRNAIGAALMTWSGGTSARGMLEFSDAMATAAIGQAVAYRKSWDTPARREEHLELTRRGVIDATPDMADIQFYMARMTPSTPKITDAWLESIIGKTATPYVKSLSNVPRGVFESWAIMDQAAKIVTYKDELRHFERLYGEGSEQAKEEAAYLTRKRHPSYKNMGSWMKQLRRSPFVMPFMFNAEIVRMVHTTLEQANKEMASSNPIERQRGQQRFLHQISGMVGDTIAVTMASRLAGVTGADERDYRKGLPWYYQNAHGFFRRLGDDLQFIPLTWINPYSMYTETAMAMAQGDGPLDAFVKGSLQMVRNVVGAEIALPEIMALAKGKTKEGVAIFSPNDSLEDKLLNLSKATWKALGPGTLSRYTPKVLEDPSRIPADILGLNPKTYDLRSLYRRQAGNELDAIDQDTRLFSRNWDDFMDGKIETDDLRQIYKTSERNLATGFNKMSQLYAAMQRQMPLKANEIMRSLGVSNQDIEAYKSGVRGPTRTTAPEKLKMYLAVAPDHLKEAYETMYQKSIAGLGTSLITHSKLQADPRAAKADKTLADTRAADIVIRLHRLGVNLQDLETSLHLQWATAKRPPALMTTIKDLSALRQIFYKTQKKTQPLIEVNQ